MAKNVIPEELNLMIQEYLTDGVITDKERKVLLRKAEKLGLDVDEIDLYITAQEQKVEQAADVAVRKRKGQSCPFCGGSVPMLAEKCPHCGQQLTVEASKELKEILDKLEEALIDFKSGKDFDRSKATAERYIRKANLYYSENPKIKMLLDEVNTQMAKAEKNYKKRNKWYRKHPYVASYIVIELIIIIAAYICGFRLDSIEKDEHRIPIITGTLLFPAAVMVYLSENNKEKS